MRWHEPLVLVRSPGVRDICVARGLRELVLRKQEDVGLHAATSGCITTDSATISIDPTR